MASSYLDKYKGVDDRPSVYDILQKVGTTEYRNEEKREYEAVDISKVKIDEITLTNYGAYSFIWEKTYVKSPERSSDGSLGNLNSYATFLTPHLILDFSIMSIADYRAIMKLHYERNEFTVECYDPIYEKKITAKMYFATEEMAKLYTIAQNRLKTDGTWEEWVDLVGVSEYKVELIGTNNDLDLVSVRYEYNPPKDENNQLIYPTAYPIPPQYEEDVYVGEEIIIGQNSTFPSIPPSNEWQFDKWNTQADGNGEPKSNGLALSVNGDLTLYAQWKKSTGRTLSFNYGLSDPKLVGYDPNTGVPIYKYNITINKGDKIGTLPEITEEPQVTYNNERYHAYENGGWYRIPTKDENMRVTADTIFWTDRDDIIYCLYDAKKFTVTYVTNKPSNAQGTIDLDVQNIAYGQKIYMPTLFLQGYKFDGWFMDADFETKASANAVMPPMNITLYAKWSEYKK